LYWLSEIKEIDKDVPVILMTAYGEVELAVEALKNGATDFILKPWNNEKLYASVNLAVDISRKNKNFLNGKIFKKMQKIMNCARLQALFQLRQNFIPGEVFNDVLIRPAEAQRGGMAQNRQRAIGIQGN
jgi:FixJ family two-component response regulator